jgi:hypothetical protein
MKLKIWYSAYLNIDQVDDSLQFNGIFQDTLIKGHIKQSVQPSIIHILILSEKTSESPDFL